jgi:hypothetical protein
LARPALGVAIRKYLQRSYFRGWKDIAFPRWPVDSAVEEILEQLLVLAMKSRGVTRVPFIWFWPNGTGSCTVMTHDVEAPAGLRFCSKLMDIDDDFGVKSSFQIVPEDRYSVSSELLEEIRSRGFEINIHDLNHDGRLTWNLDEFNRRAEKINRYGRLFGASGFRAAVMYRNLDWYENLDFSYDMSVPNVAHLEPQQGGCCTVMPFRIGKMLELPLTTTQDYSLFNILNDYSINLWKEQIALIQKKHGFISFTIHPDYIVNAAARRVYTELLAYITGMKARGETWLAMPGEVAHWWQLRSKMELVRDADHWRIVGQGSERATVAYAIITRGDELSYEVGQSASETQLSGR